MTKLALIISENEGFPVAGSIPQRRNNPGDLRHAPHISHEGIGPNDIGIEPSVADGWADLERQLELYAKRGLTLKELAYEYAPPSDNNNTEAYLDSICRKLPATPDTLVKEALLI